MKLRKRNTLLIAFCSILAFMSHGELSVLALNQRKYKEPINTCADLQKIANRGGAKKGYAFQGFEGLPIQTDIYPQKDKGTDRLCQLGYFTKVSPMGKQICKGHIYTNVESSKLSWGIGRFRSTFYDPENYESEYCRYIN
jgi:hypothetical protein